jgi:hypothetical protein
MRDASFFVVVWFPRYPIACSFSSGSRGRNNCCWVSCLSHPRLVVASQLPYGSGHRYGPHGTSRHVWPRPVFSFLVFSSCSFLLLLLFNVLSLFYLHLLHRLKRRVVLIPRSTHLSTHAQINHRHSRSHFGVLNFTSTYTLALRHTKCRQPWLLWPPCFWFGGVGRKVEDEGMDGQTSGDGECWVGEGTG